MVIICARSNAQFTRTPTAVQVPWSEIVFALVPELDPLLACSALHLPLLYDQRSRVVVQKLPALLFISSGGPLRRRSNRRLVVSTLIAIRSAGKSVVSANREGAREDNRHVRRLSSLTLLYMSRPFVHGIRHPATHTDPPVAPFTKCPARLQFAAVRLFSQVLNSLLFRPSDRSRYRFRNGFIIVYRFCWGCSTPVSDDSVEWRGVGRTAAL